MEKVNCSVCGSLMDCPETMLDAQTHTCANCTEEIAPDDYEDESLEDIPQEIRDTFTYAEQIVDELTKKRFEILWKDDKDYLKELSRKDLAKEMLSEGMDYLLALLVATGFTKKDIIRLKELVEINETRDEEKLKALIEKWKKEFESESGH